MIQIERDRRDEEAGAKERYNLEPSEITRRKQIYKPSIRGDFYRVKRNCLLYSHGSLGDLSLFFWEVAREAKGTDEERQ